MEERIKSKIEIKLTEGERDLLYFYLLGVYSLEDIETFEEYPAVVDKLEESITEVAKSTRRRRGVKSKMKKLERVKPMALMGMMGEVAPQWVAKELNKIIDHLNSQDQEEERKLQVEMQDEYPVSHGDEEIKDRRKPHDFRPYYENEEFEDTPEEINPYEKITKEYAGAFAKDEEKEDIKRLREDNQDTPEQTESDVQEWEKKWEEFFLYVTNDKNWVDGRPEWKGNVYITLYNAMKDFIRQLLEERECKAREEGKREIYEAIVFDKNIPHDVTTFVAANLWKNMRDKAKEELSKLTTK